MGAANARKDLGPGLARFRLGQRGTVAELARYAQPGVVAKMGWQQVPEAGFGEQHERSTRLDGPEGPRSRDCLHARAARVHVPRRTVDPYAPRCHTRYAILGMEVPVSVRHSLLALLSAGPMHGYGLKTEFEAATGEVWPLNVGQVYTTLRRLERDGLVTAEADADGQKVYEITGAGRDELGRWFETPVPREVVPRQELAIKLVFAMRSGVADVAAVVQRQRVATVRALQDVTRLKAAAESAGDLAWLLMLDALVFQAEAEARWLDMCEARLARENIAAGMARRHPENPAERAVERSS